jgi:hypothetical protein
MKLSSDGKADGPPAFHIQYGGLKNRKKLNKQRPGVYRVPNI